MSRKFVIGLLVALLLAIQPDQQSIGQHSTPSGSWGLAEEGPEGENFDQISLFFRIDHDPGKLSFVYWAQQFWLKDGTLGYMGLQTTGSNGDDYKILLFSIWDASDSAVGDIPNTRANPFGGEGVGQQVFCRYDWKVGHTYEFRLSHEGENWWKVDLYDSEHGLIGMLGKIKSTSDKVQGHSTTFTEVYVNNRVGDTIPYAKATFSQPVGHRNGERVPFGTPVPNTYGNFLSFQYPSDHPLAVDQVHYGVKTTLEGNDLVHEIGLSNGPKSWDVQLENGGLSGDLFCYENPYNLQTEYFRLRNDGKYWYFPFSSESNNQWEHLGGHIPITNNSTKIFTWKSGDQEAKQGDLYFIKTSRGMEFFQLKADGEYGYFPIDSNDNQWWKYIGVDEMPRNMFRYQKAILWDEENRTGKRGDIYSYENPFTGDLEYFELKTNGPYWYFPIDKSHNTWWRYLGKAN